MRAAKPLLRLTYDPRLHLRPYLSNASSEISGEANYSPSCKIQRGGLCPSCKIQQGGDYVLVVKFMGGGGDFVHVYKNEQGGGEFVLGDFVLHSNRSFIDSNTSLRNLPPPPSLNDL